MGIVVSCARTPHTIETTGIARVVHYGGVETEYMAPLSVKDVLVEHPQHLIFNAGELQSGNPRPISGKEELLPGHVYIVVPLSALQSQDFVSLASKLDDEEDSFHSSTENDDTDRVSNSRENLERILGKERLQELREARQMGICDTQELRMAYVNHLLNKNRSVSWRPELGTIQEGSFAF